MLRLIVLGVVAVAAAWFFRYDVTRDSSATRAYVLDRWTGEMSFCQGPQCFPAKSVEPASHFADLIQEKEAE